MKEIKPENLKSGSNLEKVLASGQFACTGEIGPLTYATFDNIDKHAEEMGVLSTQLTLQTTRLLLYDFPVGQHHYACFNWEWSRTCKWFAGTGTAWQCRVTF